MGKPEVLVVTMAPGRRTCSTRPSIAFDLQIFGDGFDDPVNLGELGQVIFEIASVD
jgi:hypothetical protein